MKTLVVNFYAGPGTGKSTVAAHVFALLKWQGMNVEMALEYAKDKVWEESFGVLSNQMYVLGKQLHRVHRLTGKVQVVLTDAPLGHSLFYGETETPEFKAMVLDLMSRQNSLNIFLERTKPYNPAGRYQTEDEAKAIDVRMKALLDENKIFYITVPASQDQMEHVADLVKTAYEVGELFSQTS